MIAHVAAASLVNEARVLAHPASVDNITTSGGKEDHVSMGMTSALKLRSIVDLAENLLAIELLAAAQGLEHRRPLKLVAVSSERSLLCENSRRRSRTIARSRAILPVLLKRFVRAILIQERITHEWKANHSRAARQ
jgi:histidine ammonia-lyase